MNSAEERMIRYLTEGPFSSRVVSQIAAEYPELTPEVIARNIIFRLGPTEVERFAEAHLMQLVIHYRRIEARRTEEEAEKRAAQAARVRAKRERAEAAQEEQQRAIWAVVAEERAAIEQAERETAQQALERFASPEFFQQLMNSPITALADVIEHPPWMASYHGLEKSVWGAFYEWCGDRFDAWMDRAEAELEDVERRHIAEIEQNHKASVWCEEHHRRECTAITLSSGQRCHFLSRSEGRCYRHGGREPDRGEVPRLHDALYDFYPGGRARRETDKFLREYAAKVRLEVTAELLGTSFALGDGTSVTWGEATVDQHRQRVEMLSANAAGVVETAARHVAAVRMCEEAGVSCLAELTQERASVSSGGAS
jgi:hypothetical protein